MTGQQRDPKIVDMHSDDDGRPVFKVRPALQVNPGSRVRRDDGDEWVVKEVIQVGPRTTLLCLDGVYEPHLGDTLQVC